MTNVFVILPLGTPKTKDVALALGTALLGQGLYVAAQMYWGIVFCIKQ
jgi:hypothetical protein